MNHDDDPGEPPADHEGEIQDRGTLTPRGGQAGRVLRREGRDRAAEAKRADAGVPERIEALKQRLGPAPLDVLRNSAWFSNLITGMTEIALDDPALTFADKIKLVKDNGKAVSDLRDPAVTGERIATLERERGLGKDTVPADAVDRIPPPRRTAPKA